MVALVGSPNVGKSTLFNQLTGMQAEVANWPGVTVEILQGKVRHRGQELLFVDLPGVYSLTPESKEEAVTRDFILKNDPDVIVVILDAINMEKTLYLGIQARELSNRVIFVVNKMDIAHSEGIHINFEALRSQLKAPVIPISARSGQGISHLIDHVLSFYPERPFKVNYGILEKRIEEIASILRGSFKGVNERGLAVQLLEGDETLLELVPEGRREKILEVLRKARQEVKIDLPSYIVGKRYEFVESILRRGIIKEEIKERESQIDRAFYNPVLGPLLSVVLLIAVFFFAISLGMGFPINVILSSLGFHRAAEAITEWNPSAAIGHGFDYLESLLYSAASSAGLPKFLQEVLIGGALKGVAMISVFIPPVLLFYIAFSLLEDSGLYARMATSLTAFFEKFGLSGKGPFPMVISFGCNVPGVMSARIALEEEERHQMILAVPFIPCQARLLVILALSSYFIYSWQRTSFIVFLYLLGIFLYLITSLLVRRLVFKKSEPPLTIVEIPPIHSPSPKVVWWTAWRNLKDFLLRISEVVIPLSILAVFLMHFGPHGYSEGIRGTFAYYIGQGIGKIFLPFGLSSEEAWRVGYAILNGIIAKEMFIVATAVVSGSFSAFLDMLSPSQVLSLGVFITTYIPCLATLGIMIKESRPKYVLGYVLYSFAIAYSLSYVVYLISSHL